MLLAAPTERYAACVEMDYGRVALSIIEHDRSVEKYVMFTCPDTTEDGRSINCFYFKLLAAIRISNNATINSKPFQYEGDLDTQ